MIGLIWGCFKLAVIALIVLVISQVSVGDKRICDHVHWATQHQLIQGPIQWVSSKFDHAATSSLVHKAKSEAIQAAEHKIHKITHSPDAEHSASDKIRLSGLLKR